jgi:broad specificity phosphatase PhoE
MYKEFESADTDEFTVLKLDGTQKINFLIKKVKNFLQGDRNVKRINIYMIRHLATEYNKRGIYMGRLLDPPIIEEDKGSFVETINKLHLTLTNNSKVLFVSSPAMRCLQTVELLQNTLKINNRTIQKVEEFNETNYGLFAGKTAREIKENFPDIFKRWMEKPSKVEFPEGEKYIDVQNRAYSKLLDLIKNNQGIGTIFICTHVDIIKLILCRILSLSIKHRRLFRVDYGSFSCLQNISGIMEVKFINFK